MIAVRSDEELAIIRKAGRILARIMQQVIKNSVRSGKTTKEIDELAYRLIEEAGAEPAFLNYRGYPATICTSINEEVVHGIPSSRKLVEGDIVSLDLGLRYQGFYVDMAITVGVGKVSSQANKLIKVTQKALEKGIYFARQGYRVGDISSTIQQFVESHKFSVVRQFVGHGIGKNLHEEPEIPNFGKPCSGPVLEAGMVLAIEPMVNYGSWECEILSDGWTAVTKDRSLSAHFEHTVIVGIKKPEVVTCL
ncbi:MAG: type I methionyl aminopeptidase [Candidatus Omnitrophica bacterium]|nr:type I methionyl aminopeptidase [Candidatus Omnitrophota bacterium]